MNVKTRVIIIIPALLLVFGCSETDFSEPTVSIHTPTLLEDPTLPVPQSAEPTRSSGTDLPVEQGTSPAENTDEPPYPLSLTAASTAPSIAPESLAWDPTGRWLAFTTIDGSAWLRQAGSESALSVSGLQAEYPADLKVSWSPEGDRFLVYGAWGSNYPRWTGMWLVPLDGANLNQPHTVVEPVRPKPPVFQNEGVVYAADWSTDGKWVAYSFQGEAWIYDLESGVHEQLTTLTENPLKRETSFEPFDAVRRLALSPDGSRLALEFSCNCPSPFSGVGVVDLVEGAQVKLLVDGGQLIGWSPWGHWIVVQNVAGDFGVEYTFDFYGVEPTTGLIQNLTRSNPHFDPLIDGYENFQPSSYMTAYFQWGPEGRYLYATLDWTLSELGAEAPPAMGFIARASPETVLEGHIATEESWYLFPTWLPDYRLGYIEAEPGHPEPVDMNWNVYQSLRIVIDGNVVDDQPRYLSGAVWAPGGSSLALVIPLEPGKPESQIEILTIKP